ncbi:MAG: hypothetical protein ACJ79P_07635, partial [Myxococcales bacterium]
VLQSLHSRWIGQGLNPRIVPTRTLLGRMYEAVGEPQSAVREYRWVLRLWSDADPHLKELAEVRTRLAALERTSGR